MNVGKLKKLIEDLSDDVVILVPSYDHQYSQANVYVGTAEYNKVQRSYHQYDDRDDSDNIVECLIVE